MVDLGNRGGLHPSSVHHPVFCAVVLRLFCLALLRSGILLLLLLSG